MFEKVGGRKFVLTVLGCLLLTFIPVMYAKNGVDSIITQMVIGAIAAAIGAFGVTNVIADKFAQKKEEEKKDGA